jgi:hypothetical protein
MEKGHRKSAPRHMGKELKNEWLPQYQRQKNWTWPRQLLGYSRLEKTMDKLN